MSLAKMFNDGIKVVLDPSSIAKVKMGIVDSMKTYYLFSLVPVAIGLLLGMVLFILLGSAQVAQQLGVQSMNGTVALTFLRGLILVLGLAFWVYIPVGILLLSGLYYFVGKALGFFNGTYSDTLLSVVFGVLAPLVMLGFYIIPVIGVILVLMAGLWGTFALVTALSIKQKTSKLKSFVVWIIGAVVLFFLLLAVAAWYIGAMGGT